MKYFVVSFVMFFSEAVESLHIWDIDCDCGDCKLFLSQIEPNYCCFWFAHWCFATLHDTVYPKKYARGFVVLCFVVVMQSFIMNSHEVFIHIHQGCFAGTGAIVRLPQCQWSKPDGYGKISQCITTTKHSKAKTVCIFLGIYCKFHYTMTQHQDCFYWYNIQWFIISVLSKWAVSAPVMINFWEWIIGQKMTIILKSIVLV